MILSAGIVVVRQERGEWKFLFLRAYKNWDFPKGMVEAQEDPLEAARREVQEEAGIMDLDFPWGHVFKETAPYYSRGKKVARYYIAKTPQSEVKLSTNPQLGRAEHHEYRWLSCDELREKAPKRLLPVVQWAHELLRT